MKGRKGLNRERWNLCALFKQSKQRCKVLNNICIYETNATKECGPFKSDRMRPLLQIKFEFVSNLIKMYVHIYSFFVLNFYTDFPDNFYPQYLLIYPLKLILFVITYVKYFNNPCNSF